MVMQLGSQEINDQLPADVAKFCAQFPSSSRVCRLVNHGSGTLLDIKNSSLNLKENELPIVVGESKLVPTADFIICSSKYSGNPESHGQNQYWVITPFGGGQAIIPIPKDGSMTVRYLSSSSPNTKVACTLSPFPVSWIIVPSRSLPDGQPKLPTSDPRGLYEKWTCMIFWPHSQHEPRVLEIYTSNANSNTAACPQVPSEQSRHHFWSIQFVRSQHMDIIPAVLPQSESFRLTTSGSLPTSNDNKELGGKPALAESDAAPAYNNSASASSNVPGDHDFSFSNVW
ncbi:hypothetical protein NP233_g9436 [Leucocoprinus birnbaumii]|uniref:Uncharacterized protein n=1 Tax=Leucocoprinus birnbaumii TaxID=56174 RepID=A0AAD5VKD9_9AGAR|nr:hypothetical protein NP233_g9436 [Leucocoprinus birnbaumii]